MKSEMLLAELRLRCEEWLARHTNRIMPKAVVLKANGEIEIWDYGDNIWNVKDSDLDF